MHKSSSIAGFRIFQHLLVSDRVSECRIGPASNHQVNTFRLTGKVIVEQKFWFFSKDRLSVFIIRVFYPSRSADYLLDGDAIGFVRIHPNKILSATSDNVSFEPLSRKIAHDLLHGLVSKISVRTFPTLIFCGKDP